MGHDDAVREERVTMTLCGKDGECRVGGGATAMTEGWRVSKMREGKEAGGKKGVVHLIKSWL